jgi:peptide chain release factor 1
VPQTEASGRIHPAATVAVMPEAEDVDVEVHEKDPAPTGSAPPVPVGRVSIRPIPPCVLTAHPERHRGPVPGRALTDQELAKALRVLKARLLEAEQERQQGTIAAERKKMVGSGDSR